MRLNVANLVNYNRTHNGGTDFRGNGSSGNSEEKASMIDTSTLAHDTSTHV